MRLAAYVLAALAALAGVPAGAQSAAFRSNGIDYLSLSEGSEHLGLRTEKLDPPTAVILKEGAKPVARFSDHSRECDIRGLRVFLGDPVLERGGSFFVSRTDFQSRIQPRFRPDLGGAAPREPRLIAVDPGHGGMDRGTENRALGTMEKTYTLDVGLRLKRLLEAAGYRVVMTRETDTDVQKQTRSEIANLARADLFVSIHFNSLYPNTKTTGVEILSFPPRTQRSTNSWSPGEKDDSESQEAPVNAFNAWNTVLSEIMHRHLLEALRSGDRGEKFEHLGVLRGLRCPGVLVEPAFLSSDSEAPRLATPAFREEIASAILAGIEDYGQVVRSRGPATVTSPGSAPAPAPAATRSAPTRPSPGT
jgi:N-acetylmuramoyl-L-alanine amidase